MEEGLKLFKLKESILIWIKISMITRYKVTFVFIVNLINVLMKINTWKYKFYKFTKYISKESLCSCKYHLLKKISLYQKIYLSSQIIKPTCYIVGGESLIDQFACPYYLTLLVAVSKELHITKNLDPHSVVYERRMMDRFSVHNVLQ